MYKLSSNAQTILILQSIPFQICFKTLKCTSTLILTVLPTSVSHPNSQFSLFFSLQRERTNFLNNYSAKIEQGVRDCKQILKEKIQYRYYPDEAPGYSFCGKGKYKSLQHCSRESC